MRPVDYKATTPFLQRGNWIAGYHTGTDFACPVGTKVRPSKTGKVVAITYDQSYGHMVTIQSWYKGRRIRHMYAHLSRIEVRVGQRVSAAGRQVIALSGNTGNSTGPHLHYEERVKPFGYWNHIRPVLLEVMPKKGLRK